jgi:hypothetical protein
MARSRTTASDLISVEFGGKGEGLLRVTFGLVQLSLRDRGPGSRRQRLREVPTGHHRHRVIEPALSRAEIAHQLRNRRTSRRCLPLLALHPTRPQRRDRQTTSTPPPNTHRHNTFHAAGQRRIAAAASGPRYPPQPRTRRGEPAPTPTTRPRPRPTPRRPAHTDEISSQFDNNRLLLKDFPATLMPHRRHRPHHKTHGHSVGMRRGSR